MGLKSEWDIFSDRHSKFLTEFQQRVAANFRQGRLRVLKISVCFCGGCSRKFSIFCQKFADVKKIFGQFSDNPKFRGRDYCPLFSVHDATAIRPIGWRETEAFLLLLLGCGTVSRQAWSHVTECDGFQTVWLCRESRSYLYGPRIKTRQRHTTALRSSLAAYPVTHWLRALRDGSSLSAWTCSILPDGAHHAVRSCTQPSWSQVNWVEDRASIAHSFTTWRSGVRRRSTPCMEQSAVLHSFSRLCWLFQQKSQDTSF